MRDHTLPNIRHLRAPRYERIILDLGPTNILLSGLAVAPVTPTMSAILSASLLFIHGRQLAVIDGKFVQAADSQIRLQITS